MEEVTKSQLEEMFKARRSHYPKHFTGDQIDDSTIETILQYAGMAPNHKKTKPWKFQIFKEDALTNLVEEMKQYYLRVTPVEEISEVKLSKFEEKKIKTSHVLAILVKKDEKKRVPEIEEVEATACAVQNIYLALSSFGIGGYWSTGKFTYEPSTRTLLNLSSNEDLLGFFVLGIVKDKLPKAGLPDINEYVSWVK
jgi:nitroreductase